MVFTSKTDWPQPASLEAREREAPSAEVLRLQVVAQEQEEERSAQRAGRNGERAQWVFDSISSGVDLLFCCTCTSFVSGFCPRSLVASSWLKSVRPAPRVDPE